MVLRLVRWLVPCSFSIYYVSGGLAAALTIEPVVPSENQLIFAPEISALHDRIFVKDIAQCLGHQDFCDEALNLFLINAPPPGETTTLDLKTDVRDQLTPQLTHYPMQILGAEKIKVVAKVVTIGKDELTQFCEQSITQFLRAHYLNLRIRNLRILMAKNVLLRPTNYSLALSVLTEFGDEPSDVRRVFELLGGRKVLEIKVNRDDLSLPQLSTKAQLHLELDQHSLVTRDNLMRGHQVRHEDLEYRWLPLMPSNLQAIQSPKAIVGHVLTHSVRAGTLIVERMLAQESLVQRGSLVKLRLQNGTMQLQGEAKALGSGGLNENIRVYYAATKKTLNAKVVGANLVEVAL